MPSTKKTRKTAKTAAARSTSKAARAKSRMSKAPSAQTKSKSGSASTSTRAGRAKSKSPAATKVRAVARASRSAGSISGKNRSIARSAPKGSAKTGEVRSSRAKTSAAKTTARTAAKTAAAKTAAAKTAATKSKSAKSAKAAASRSRKPLEAAVAASARASVEKITQVSKKSTESRAKAAVHKETSPDISKVSPSKKATQHIQTMAKTNLKAVEPADASVPASVKLHATPLAKPAPALARTAPDPRPASRAPVMQPRETSEQNPVTQKKASIPSAAKPVPTPPVVPPEAPRPIVAKPTKPTGAKFGFKTHEHIVYPAHGVGQIVAIEEQEVAGFTLELFVISFVKDKMILKVPTPKVVSVGMRKLAEAPVIAKSLDTLTGRARIKRTMWSRRAQEYEAKINSGDLIAIAEVVRDLYRSEAQPEQSYSERQLYEAALDRMGRELAVVQKLTEQESLKLIEAQLQKGPRRASKAEAEPDDEIAAGDVDEAA